MNRLYFLYLLVFSSFSITAFSQDTLPKFSVRNAGKERYIIGWVNNYEQVSQISIQRSFDSLRNFKTILSVADPNSKQNGYVDKDAVNDHMFYRLFIVLSGGSYFFTEAKKPYLDTAKKVTATIPSNKPDNVATQNPVVNPQEQIANTTKTKDTIAVVKKEIFVPSFYVYTNKKDGNVFLNLPDADEKKYSVRFFEEDGTPLFEIKTIKEPSLIIDKANFLHAGWFRFELYEGEKLKEKHKFYLAKDF